MPQRQPDAAQQEEFGRQLELMINQLKSHPSIFSWVCLYDTLTPKQHLTYSPGNLQRRLGPARQRRARVRPHRPSQKTGPNPSD